MTFCRYCGKEIHHSAPTCPQCGGVQVPEGPAALAKPASEGTLWLPVAGLVLSILTLLALLDESEADVDTIVGMAMFSVLGLVFGVVSIRTQEAGKRMAIAAVVMSSIGLLALVGLAQP
ncbi:MAG TPA: zinc ribbon domain-containing protein [Telluria sp.]